jgi:hypothetical protein
VGKQAEPSSHTNYLDYLKDIIAFIKMKEGNNYIAATSDFDKDDKIGIKNLAS